MNVVVCRGIFTPVLTEALRDLLRREVLFEPATVTGDATWRAGRVAHVQHLLEGRLAGEAVLAAVPRVLEALGLAPFAPQTCEVQLSAYGDGEYFRCHTDDGTPDVAARRLSWVAYLDAVPGHRPWTEGRLIVRDGIVAHVVTPADGETVFFPASALHEILPVVAPPEWPDRRFSVNGWVR